MDLTIKDNVLFNNKNEEIALMFNDQIVYHDHDKTMIGLRVGINHGMFLNDDMIFLEGKVVDLKHDNKKIEKLFQKIYNSGSKYFVILKPEYSEMFLDNNYIQELKDKRNEK